MSTKKKPVKQAAKWATSEKVEQAAPPVRYPEHKGTPLRPEQLPTLEELSILAASLARSLPYSETKADTLVRSALSLWLASRDCLNEQKQLAGKYWGTMDQSHEGIERGYAQVKLRLEKMGALELADQLLLNKHDFHALSWVETEALFFPDSEARDRSLQLAHLVPDALLGTEGWWRLWTLNHFKELGFSHMALITLIQFFDYQESEREKAEVSQRMKRVRAQRPKKTKWGKLANPTSRKKDP